MQFSYSTQGTHVIHWSFDDGNGNISTATQNVVIADITAPAVPTLADVTGECSATATTATTTDNCSGTITGTTADDLSYSTQGTHVIHWNFDDGNGNISTTTQNVVIADITAPVVPTLADVTGECSATATTATTTDNCSGTITGTTADDLSYNTQGTHVIHWSFDDGNGNISTTTQNVVIADITAPVVPTLADVTGECSATATTATTTDNCSGTITGTTADDLSYSTQGTHVIHWSFDDGNGNISTTTQNVVIADITAPAVPTLADVTGECSATATTATTTDNCSGTITGTTPDDLSYTTQGTHVIHWSFDDGNGNISTTTQNVVIADITAPVVPTLADVTGECSATATTATTTDNCSGTITGTTADDLTYSTQGTHVIHWSFDDGNGNISTTTQNVVIADITAPVITGCPSDITTCNAVVSWTVPSALDNCSGLVTLTSDHNPGETFPVGTTTVIYTATDLLNNTSTCSFTVTVNPTVTVNDPTDQVVCNSTPTTTVTFTGAVTGTTYNWTNDNTSIGLAASGSDNIASFTAINNSSTIQVATITVTPVANSCTGTPQTFTITVNQTPSTPVVTVVNNCGTSTLSTTAAGTLLWSTGENTSSITVNTADTYTVTQTENGCTSAAGSGIAAPKTTPSEPVVTVENNCGTSTLSTTATGTLSWSTGETTSSITVNTAGTYTVTQTVNGCTSAAGSGIAAPKAVPSAPVVTVVNNCGTSTLSTTAAGTLLWSTGENTSSITVITAGTYTVTQTVNGCTSAAGSGIAAPKAVPSAPVVTVVNNCGTSTLSTTATGTLLWSTGESTSSITVSTAATYTVTQTVNGCTSAAGSGIAAPKVTPPAPIVSVVNNCGTSILSTTAAGTLLWSTGESTSSITVSASGYLYCYTNSKWLYQCSRFSNNYSKSCNRHTVTVVL